MARRLLAVGVGMLVVACAQDSGSGLTGSERGPLIEVVAENRTAEVATVELHSRATDGSGVAELLVDGCHASWASAPLGPQWSVSVNGAEVIDEGSQLPPAEPGESVVITVELDAEGAQVTDITVGPTRGAPDPAGSRCL